ncbi:hypothetical protein AWH48_07895 [Domibacillus aminovorans]|uniref:Uncharacterized protein n=1 Tax=Domibacillus aminovorans TaxID=29332 RepID=A0A177KN01_9BACI|nr:hypothetical protein [Domibacillus aminovorans]OAH54507.1 hypothetical protein AWH48_07895 [Domibacillus aminovorans]
MNETKQLEMSIDKPYEEVKAVTFIQKMIITWHKHHYLKYQYLEEGCMNKKIRKELEGKKVYHYEKYVKIL